MGSYNCLFLDVLIDNGGLWLQCGVLTRKEPPIVVISTSTGS
jgi:hypothetical protein